jgi:hypothetical protein
MNTVKLVLRLILNCNWLAYVLLGRVGSRNAAMSVSAP